MAPNIMDYITCIVAVATIIFFKLDVGDELNPANHCSVSYFEFSEKEYLYFESFIRLDYHNRYSVILC